jgi:hypothetical protein
VSPPIPDSSPGHPVATAEQHEHELAALELVEHPTVRAAYAEVAATWLGRAKASEAMLNVFEPAFEEVMFWESVTRDMNFPPGT